MAASNREDVQRHCWSFALRELLRRGTSWHFELCEDTMKDCEGFGSTDSDKTRDAKLMWLLRDFLLELVDEKGRRMTPDEYLESSLRKTPRDAVESQRSQAAREVRETLLQSFPDRRCVTLCQPVIDEEQLRQLSEVPFEHLRPEFRRGFQDLQTQLLRLAMSHPKTVQGEAICASAWAAMLRKLVAALNEGTALNVVNAWNQVQHSACNDLSAELQSRVLEEFQKAPTGQLGFVRTRAQSMTQMLRQVQEMQDRAADPSDPRSQALMNALDSDLPSKPILRAVREALSTSRMARLKWDGNSDALKAKLKLATDELESKAAYGLVRFVSLQSCHLDLQSHLKQTEAAMAAAATKLDGEQLEKPRPRAMSSCRFRCPPILW
ncbi:unnamed protein product [Durusdinium trenchii]|uniref:GB1/RHD3-type G domain-containing protein n=1 Tax=Durusdinium trenchii TaxID=1381693 RepID=A0ABP0RIJ4_9DINO